MIFAYPLNFVQYLQNSLRLQNYRIRRKGRRRRRKKCIKKKTISTIRHHSHTEANNVISMNWSRKSLEWFALKTSYKYVDHHILKWKGNKKKNPNEVKTSWKSFFFFFFAWLLRRCISFQYQKIARKWRERERKKLYLACRTKMNKVWSSFGYH